MRRTCRFLLAVVCLTASCALPAASQTNAPAPPASPPPAPQPSSTPQKSKKPVVSDASDKTNPVAEVRRTTALLLVNSLADEARDFRDLTLRARVQMRVAEMLWETEQTRARTLFRRAWDAASVADDESRRRRDEEMQAQLKKSGSAMFGDVPDLRAEVLRLATRRDPKLGEEFLAQMDEERKRAEEEAAKSSANAASAARSGNELPASLQQRLGLASELLREGETERAVQLAAPALGYLTTDSISFLTLLRPKNAPLADRFYAVLLNSTATNPQADANSVSLLSSYAFTPGLFITATRGGGLSSQSTDIQHAPDLDPNLRASFFRIATQILLRPLAPPEQDRTSAGRFGTHFIAARLLPLYERYAPDAMSLLHARVATLAQELSERQRNLNQSVLAQGITPPASPETVRVGPSSDDIPQTLDDIERLIKPDTTPEERDRLYMRAALRAGSAGDIRARDFAGKIEDSDVRRQVRAYVDFDLVRGARAKGDAQETVRLAQTSEFSHLKRVWAYTEAAHLLSKTDAARAVELLETAGEDARRIDPADPDRPRALVAIATRMAEVNRPRAWEVMSEVVKASNAAAAFTGEDGHLLSQVKTKDTGNITDPRIATFDLTGIFRTLAQDDLNRAVEFAGSLTGESPRAVATLAIARAVLDKKKT